MWHMGDGWGWWMLMGWIWIVALWGLIAWGLFTVARAVGSKREDTPRELSALAILEQRYARGELSHEQFEEMRRRLHSTAAVEEMTPAPARNSGAG